MLMFEKIKKLKKNSSGQAMIMTVILMGGILFMATTVAGLLMFYQVQESTDFSDSTGAIFAADAGMERVIYYYFYEFNYDVDGACPADDPCEGPSLDLSNGTTAETSLVVPPPGVTNQPTVLSSKGRSGRAVRLLETSFLITPTR